MSGLNDISSANPSGKEAPHLGDDRIRQLIAKLIEFAAVAHTLAGKHKFGRGPLSSRPTYGNSGDLYILEVAGLLAELQYDTGTAWVTLTSRNDIAAFLLSLATHQAATTIDHPANSVIGSKIAAGALQKRHFDGGTDVTSVATLVNGSSADSLHVHSQYQTIAGEGTTEPSDLTELAAGEVVFGRSAVAHAIGSAMTSYTKVKEMQILRWGTATVDFTMSIDMGGTGLAGTIMAVIYKNGVIQGTERTLAVGIDGSGTATYSENINVSVEDLVQVYAKWITSYSDNAGNISEFQIKGAWDCLVTLP